MDLKNTNFFKNLNQDGEGLIQKRSEITTEATLASQRELIDSLKKKKRSLEMKKLKLEDIGRTNSDSLVVVNGEFDSDAWVKSIHELSVDVSLLTVQIEIAEANERKYFGGASVDFKTS